MLGFNTMKKGLFYIFMLVILASCQRRPALAPSVDPMSDVEPPPMGASTYNDELKSDLLVLKNLLDSKLDESVSAKVKEALINGEHQAMLKNQKLEGQLARLYLVLPELIGLKNKSFKEGEKLWILGKYLFLKRRFVQAAMLLSEVLALEPENIEARNWRARAIFFLGNPDKAILELEHIIKTNPKNALAVTDAQYLIGAIVYESNEKEDRFLNKGIEAWQSYLDNFKGAQAAKEDFALSFAELKNRALEKTKAPVVDPFSPRLEFTPEKNAILEAFAQEKLLLCEELAKKFLEKNNDVDVSIIQARLWFKTGRLEEALASFNELAEKNPQYAPIFHYRGMVLMMRGQAKEAVESWEQVLKWDLDYGKTHNLEQRIQVAKKMLDPQKIATH